MYGDVLHVCYTDGLFNPTILPHPPQNTAGISVIPNRVRRTVWTFLGFVTQNTERQPLGRNETRYAPYTCTHKGEKTVHGKNPTPDVGYPRGG